ncbi:hypothetical protein NDU88_002551 [Pleurodeles waltl]|uniref:Uncharacterized protein n=1 Tax=Pleurodeles waltl TaxID=8319 RepID=A0AAV7RBB5_PLEWA|nr:hypothetical protein NDU88_002551 [Pleurodeles waltl]
MILQEVGHAAAFLAGYLTAYILADCASRSCPAQYKDSLFGLTHYFTAEHLQHRAVSPMGHLWLQGGELEPAAKMAGWTPERTRSPGGSSHGAHDRGTTCFHLELKDLSFDFFGQALTLSHNLGL